ncbi:Na+/H+ antiporter NhaC [Lentilactobacillus laojiaonis]|uniref:Na+/H+ antiporter NhaC n=1 Tax=Lentilactobacillus laojiaonis TaxID=2883998 RepID=UPI001D09D046|nr:Na+/H+ antiporter NhaC [Lentilactobacillus laojiaonis]UDM32065.1 Na+/H+ antiporter NhaC [Lentilactobacillus laojiaonis]
MQEQQPQVSLLEGITILIIMLIIMGISIIGYQITPVIPILLVILLLMGWGKFKGYTWDTINDGLSEGVLTGIIPIFIFILIGALISVWIYAGVIPSMMVYGFKLISAKYFLVSVFVVCSLIGLAIGSAFTVISTIGIAFLGMGITLGMHPALIAGAIISGAIFGDKTSPLSASANLASAVVGADLFSHIKNMLWTTIPAFLVSIIGFIFLGNQTQTMNTQTIQTTIATLNQHFNISWLSLIPIVAMLGFAWKKVPAIPTIFINIVLTMVLIFIDHPNENGLKIIQSISEGYASHTGNAQVDTLLTRGGINSMLPTILLVIVALGLGGLLIKLQIIRSVMEPVSKHLTSTGSLITAVILSAIGVNLFVGEQYLSVILPGNAFKNAFQKAGLAPVTLSRALEDGGTVINYLVPWGVAGIFAANTLGVSTLSYFPFVIFSWVSPIISIISGFTGIGIKYYKSSNK